MVSRTCLGARSEYERAGFKFGFGPGVITFGATIWWGFTAFFEPLTKEFGWSYAAISLAASMRGLEVGLMDIAVGVLLDRFGSRRIIFTGSILLATSCLMLSRITSLATFYIAFVLVFVGGTVCSAVVFFAVASRWFRKRLGLAMGIISAGYGAGGFGVPVIVYLLDLLGLRATFVVIGIASLVIGALIAYFLRDWPENVGSWPDGVRPLQDAKPPSRASVRADKGWTRFPAVYKVGLKAATSEASLVATTHNLLKL